MPAIRKNVPPRLATLLLPALLLIVPALAHAQAYPTKPIRFIVPFPAGGAGDIVIRALGQKFTEHWGEPVIVDNRSGASGAVGSQIAAKAPPDGYTLLLGTASTHAINPSLQPNVPFDPIKDFTAIAPLIAIPNILVAHPALPAHTLKELIQLARSKPGEIAFASNGTGTAAHMAGELFKRAAGIDIVHVPYKGAGIAINDVLGGHVQLLFGAVATSLPHVKAGRLRALAVTSLQRSVAAPDVPTMAESGLPGFEVVQWFGAFGPAGIPKTTVTALNSEIARALDSPDVKERFARQGFEIRHGSAEDFARYTRAEIAKWSKLIREAGIRGE